MRYLGKTARKVRVQAGLTQAKFAEQLGISIVHLSNIENDHSMPSVELIKKYLQITGVDLYVMDWCDNGDLDLLPVAVRDAAAKLREAWSQESKRSSDNG